MLLPSCHHGRGTDVSRLSKPVYQLVTACTSVWEKREQWRCLLCPYTVSTEVTFSWLDLETTYLCERGQASPPDLITVLRGSSCRYQGKVSLIWLECLARDCSLKLCLGDGEGETLHQVEISCLCQVLHHCLFSLQGHRHYGLAPATRQCETIVPFWDRVLV